MNLNYTGELMHSLLEKRAFDSYAVTVGIGEHQTQIFSGNVNGDTLFDMASCGKILHTAPVTFQLIDEGRLSLDSTLDAFFDHVPEEKKKITVRQILTHTSGIRRTELTREQCTRGDDALAATILSVPLAFDPGTDVRYSCAGMNIIGLIDEKITGKTMEQLFVERIREPLCMTRARFKLEPYENNAAVCHRWQDAYPQQFDDPNVLAMGRVCGAGGSFFSPDDLQKFCRAVLSEDERLYSKQFFSESEKIHSPRYSGSGKMTENSRGLGYMIVDEYYPQTGSLFPVGSFGHCGHTGQSMFMNREKQLYVIINTNATRYSLIRNQFKCEDYAYVCRLRADIHNEIRKDLALQGLLQ